MKIMGCFRKQIVIGASLLFVDFFKMLGKHLFSYINQFKNYRLCGIISGAVILLSQGHATKDRCVPGYLCLGSLCMCLPPSGVAWPDQFLKRVW